MEQYTKNLYRKILNDDELFQKCDSILSQTFLGYRDVNKLQTNELGVEQNLDNLLLKKFIHSVAAIKYFDTVLKCINNRKLKKETIEAIIIFEMVQVDIADSLSEIEEIRKMDDQLKIFSELKSSALVGVSHSLFDEKVLENQKLRTWSEYLAYLNLKFYKLVSRRNNWLIAKEIIDRRLTEYYKFICLDHVRKIEEKHRIKTDLIDSTYLFEPSDNWKPVPNWVVSKELWLNFLGDSISFLVPIFILMEFDEEITEEFLKDLIFSFRGVGLLNVWLDDLLDIDEDENKDDVNLYKMIVDKKFNEIFMQDSDPFNSLTNKIKETIVADFEFISLKYTGTLKSNIVKCLGVIKKSMPMLYFSMASEKKVQDKYLEIIKKSLD